MQWDNEIPVQTFCLLFVGNISETITDKVLQRHYDPDIIVAELVRRKLGDETLPDDTSLSDPFIRFPYRMGDVPITEKLEKFVEDVKWVVLF